MRRRKSEDWLAGLPARRVLVVSDRYPPDDVGGAELSLHLLLREPVLRDQVLVATFDQTLAEPERRVVDGVDVIALPAPAAWPLHRLSQHEVERLKTRPFLLKWLSFVGEAVACAVRDPKAHGPALLLRIARATPPGGMRMAHSTVPESRSPADIRAILDRLNPALVHADNARSIMKAATALEGLATPLVALVRDHRFTRLRFDQTAAPSDGAPPDWRKRVELRCARQALAFRQAMLQRATRVIATSGYLQRTLSEVVAPDRLTRVALVPIAPGPTAPRAPTATGAFRILLVGSLTPNKGQTHLLEGWDELSARIPDVELDLAGRGPARDDILRLVRAKGAASKVRLHGRVSPAEVAELYAACDVVALPTLWDEPFGRVSLEAGAAGKPVVAYASGWLANTVVDGVTGRLAPVGDRAALIDALGELAADPALRARMGVAGREAAAAHAPDKLARRLLWIWDDAARRR
ncbi:glycosyltransferase family 4 protein [Hansschlegelia sp. KR7-227]|uniref:glycosyltransferase family 4 protein n=1 Tax=Hansschlegelia sp. KR7-227 TaxID=3400914 RepID=UPI003C02FE57